MKINILAASDRNNYGDLLFPLIIKRHVESLHGDKIVVNNFAVIRSDLSSFGALPTKGHKDLISYIRQSKDNDDCRIVIAGGEVLGGDWLNIYRFISPFVNRLNKIPFIPYFIMKWDLLSGIFLIFFKSSYPFVLDHPYFLQRARVFYNSVGAANIKRLLPKKRKKLSTYFNQVAHISVRDNDSVKSLSKLNIPSHLVPDSALIMSDIFKEEEMLKNVSEKIRAVSTRSYVYVQLGQSKGPDNLKEFGLRLKEFSRQHSLEVILSPIGLALDHSDDKILKKLHALFPNFEYIEPANLFDIMFLIKSSKLYLGTSLHGVITSQSFNVPFVAFTEKIDKLNKYIETWFPNAKEISIKFAEFDKVYTTYTSFDYSDANERLNNQKSLIYNNLHSILK